MRHSTDVSLLPNTADRAMYPLNKTQTTIITVNRITVPFRSRTTWKVFTCYSQKYRFHQWNWIEIQFIGFPAGYYTRFLHSTVPSVPMLCRVFKGNACIRRYCCRRQPMIHGCLDESTVLESGPMVQPKGVCTLFHPISSWYWQASG